MADLGSITALKAAVAQVLQKKAPPNKITPSADRNLMYDIIDTLSAIAGTNKIVWTGDLTSGYNSITHGTSSVDFKYEVITWNATKGAYEPTEVLETKRTTTTLTIYVGDAKPTSRIIFIA